MLAALCKVSKTEPYSNSYYWGHDLDGAPDTLWGLEGYHHPVGFFLNHGSSDVFKEQMRRVDEDRLLRNTQGLGSPDYDLYYYDIFDGFLTRKDDKDRDAQDCFVAVVHLWASQDRRKQLLGILANYADRVKATKTGPSNAVQSFAVLKEVNDFKMATIYIRYVQINQYFDLSHAERDTDNFLGVGHKTRGRSLKLPQSTRNSWRMLR